MRLLFAAAATALVVAAFCAAPEAFAQDLVAKTEYRSPADARKSFTLPPGFEISSSRPTRTSTSR
jgi:hypothetical protein